MLIQPTRYINKGNEEKDRERKDIGLGEQIKLLLVGKPKGNIQKLKWGIDGNGFEQKSAEELEGSLLITLTAKKNLEEDTSVKISANTSEGRKANITINIKTPKKREGKEFNGVFEGYDGNPIVTSKYRLKAGVHGVIGFIEITTFPTNVSFKKIKLIERDGGLSWAGKPDISQPELASSHKENDCNNLINMSDKNTSYDFVSEINNNTSEILNVIYASKRNPQSFWWICNYYVHLGSGGKGSENKDSISIGTTNQKFSIKAIYEQKATVTTIEKFDAKFERNSNEN